VPYQTAGAAALFPPTRENRGSLPDDEDRAGRVVIQSLWIGERLSALERLAIQSFLDHGHPFRLYANGDVAGLPAGAELRDGRTILPETEVFQYRARGSFAAFSNFFRYKLLAEQGGFWVDTDLVCLRPFAFPAGHVFASERVARRDRPDVSRVVTTCVLGAPAGSAAMAAAWLTCQGKDKAALEWGEVGPELAAALVAAHGLEGCVAAPETFCPIGYCDWRALISAEPPALPDSARAVHFWNEMWRLAGQDKDGSYPPDSLYETLKRRHPARTATGSGSATTHGGGTPGGIP
jgi:hypothetical protein